MSNKTANVIALSSSHLPIRCIHVLLDWVPRRINHAPPSTWCLQSHYTNKTMSSHPPNSLAQASSAYLRSAMHQPIRWQEWGEEAFATAQRENKPMLLDIGAVWCHWCHVMDRESYDDPEVARIVNENFVAVKVDRDERPDIDSRYQAAVSAISGQGGWPHPGPNAPVHEALHDDLSCQGSRDGAALSRRQQSNGKKRAR